jgi:hypothetical protein
MFKFSCSIFTIILFFQLAVIAQSGPETVTGGRLGVFDGTVSTIETADFSATGSIPEHSESAWYWVCHAGDGCNGGSTFRLPFSTGIGQNIGTALPFESGNVTVGGQTYPNVFYKGNFLFSDPASDELNVLIPRFFNQWRKGERRITRPFTLLSNSKITACKVSMLNGPCPDEQVLFSKNLQGKGTVTITLRFNNQNPDMVQGASRFIRKTFEYRFEQ